MQLIKHPLCELVNVPICHVPQVRHQRRTAISNRLPHQSLIQQCVKSALTIQQPCNYTAFLPYQTRPSPAMRPKNTPRAWSLRTAANA